jgi:excisionase family DNA binding protein
MTLVSIGPIADLLGVKQHTIRTWVGAGYLPAVVTGAGRTRRFDLEAITAMRDFGQIPGRGGRYPAVPRIWAQVEQDDGCWIFTGSLNSSGYGQIRYLDGSRSTHRVMYEEIIGPISEGLQLDHLCRVRACCNPWHLEPVTPAENLRRGNGWCGRNYRKTHCKNGHEFTERNTYLSPLGRACRRCHALNEAARRARRAAALGAAGREDVAA